jgi:hypothetical protein
VKETTVPPYRRYHDRASCGSCQAADAWRVEIIALLARLTALLKAAR